MEISYSRLIHSLNLYRDAGESPEDWLVLERDAIVDTDGFVSANQVAFDMALHVAQLAYDAGLKDRKTGVWKADGAEYKEGFDEGFDVAAKDPRAWYLKDKNGDPLHIFDKAKTSDGVVMVSAITASIDPMENRVLCYNDSNEWEYKPWKIEKVEPDTREKIIEELGDIILALIESDVDTEALDHDGVYSANDLAEQFVSRVEALGVDHD